MSQLHVPFLDLPGQNHALKKDILKEWEGLLDCAGFIGGAAVENFEEEFGKTIGAAHCISVNSGTDALRFILIGLGLEPGDEVITVPNTFIATTEAISQAGGRPVFVDIDPETCNIDPECIEQAITPRTRGIIPVHLYGQPAEMDTINAIAARHDLWVVEDACQAHLAEYKGEKTGTLAAAAAFSFYPGKNLGACGDAGAVTTNDTALADRIRMIKDHGQRTKYYHEIEGYNGRCDAVQAAALSTKLPYLASWNEARRGHAGKYHELLKDVPELQLPICRPENLHAYHLFVIQVPDRDELMARLLKKGISTGLHYPVPLHLQEAYLNLGYKTGSFPITEKAASRILSLPLFPELTTTQIVHVCNSIKETLNCP